MLDKLNGNYATAIVAITALIVVLAGAVVTIVHPESLSFEQYVKAIGTVSLGAGALGIGRGILAGAKSPGGFQADPAAQVEAIVEGGENVERRPPQDPTKLARY